ncbi:MAG TPA: hypothetical protein ENK44_09020 [Caldithrix abyssi]|uniref:Uncharacterized protein n=1 Tax=Caldithrix abyssi TaxID=187145 RepID=A0A7V4U0N2_CALAY|nr:hypothetical protein [Caldithrix abyssi]
MAINKSQKRLLILLGVVLAFAIFDFINNTDTYTSFYSSSQKKKKQAAATENVQKSFSKPLTRKSYVSEWGRDPFFKKVTTQVKKKRKKSRTAEQVLFLQAISYDGLNSVALINNNVCKTGDIIAGYRIVHISQQSVTVSDGKKQTTLKLAR